MTTQMTEEEKNDLYDKVAKETTEASLRIITQNGVRSIGGIVAILGIGFVNTVRSFGQLNNDKDFLKDVLERLIKCFVEKEEKND